MDRPGIFAAGDPKSDRLLVKVGRLAQFCRTEMPGPGLWRIQAPVMFLSCRAAGADTLLSTFGCGQELRVICYVHGLDLCCVALGTDKRPLFPYEIEYPSIELEGDRWRRVKFNFERDGYQKRTRQPVARV